VLCFLGCNQVFVWLGLASIPAAATSFYQISTSTLDLTLNWAVVINLLLTYPASLLLEKWGFRSAVLILAGVSTSGAMLRALPCLVGQLRGTLWCTILLHAGSAIFGGPLMNVMPTRFAALYFPPRYRGTVTGLLSVVAPITGAIMSYLIGSTLVHSPSSVPVYMMLQAGLCVFGSIWAYLFFHDPPTCTEGLPPPDPEDAPSGGDDMTGHRGSSLGHVRALCSSQLACTMIGAGGICGLNTSFAGLLPQAIGTIKGLHANPEGDYAAMAMNVGSLILGVTVGALLDRCVERRQKRARFLTAQALAIVAVYALFAVQIPAPLIFGTDVPLVRLGIIALASLSFFAGGLAGMILPTALQLLVQLSPAGVPESTSAAILFTSVNCFSSLYLVAAACLPVQLLPLIILVGGAACALLLLVGGVVGGPRGTRG
jgi:hypothetical protein